METWRRSQIKEHPQNPRHITEAARAKLRRKMKDVGLLQPLIVNRRTGYLLGGHQRLGVMDSLERYIEGKNDYSLDVAVVDLPEKDELAMLVFLNNQSAQGAWDTDLLSEIGAGDVSFEDMGFDRIDIDLMFDGELSDGAILKDAPETLETKDSLEEIKQARKDAQKKMNKTNSVDYYVTVVCKDQGEKAKLMKHLGIPKGEIYISPAEIFALRR